jgi:hypothetical protein
MRNLFLSLVLINALAWAYQSWVIEPDRSVGALHIEQDYPRLTAVKLSRTPVSEPTPVQVDESIIVEKEAICLNIGPIAGENDAMSIAEGLRNRDVQVLQTSREGQVWVGHWVQVVGLSNRVAAEAARNRLIAAGLTDAYIVSGDAAPKISLGVFRSATSADSTVSRARAQGLETRIEERYQPGTQYWLAVELPAGRSLRPGELRSDTGQILRTVSVPCDAIDG